jgi:hypothetical protein
LKEDFRPYIGLKLPEKINEAKLLIFNRPAQLFIPVSGIGTRPLADAFFFRLRVRVSNNFAYTSSKN